MTVGRSLQNCLEWEQSMVSTFSKGGWVYKPSKRSGEPAQVCKYLGLMVDSRYTLVHFSVLFCEIVSVQWGVQCGDVLCNMWSAHWALDKLAQVVSSGT